MAAFTYLQHLGLLSVLCFGFLSLTDGQNVTTEAQYNCGPPPRILGGTPVVTPDGRFSNYTCDVGYRMIGQPQVTCQASGVWTATPTCRVQYCPTPTRPTSGSYRYPPGGFVVGAVVSFTCYTGYELNFEGDGTILCQGNFTWTNTTVNCQKKECGLPVVVENGDYSLTTNTTNYQSRAVYTCNEGYILRPAGRTNSVRELTLTCSSLGVWARAPRCEPRTCNSPPYVSNTVASSRSRTYYYGDLFDYECRAGYELAGNRSVACGKDGTWSLQPVCKSIMCGDPPKVDNAVIHNGASKTYNARVMYQCVRGYAASGALNIVCLPSGNWSFTPTCELVMCRNPPKIHNGEVTMQNKTTSYDSHAVYTCHNGYRLIGIENIRCKSNGNWETPPSCELSPGSGGVVQTGAQVSRSGTSGANSSMVGLAIACAVFGLIVLVLLIFIVVKLTCGKKGGSNWLQMQ